MDNTEWKNVEEREDEGAQASTSTAAAAADIAIETTNTDNATASTTNSNSNSALDSATVEEETTDGQKDEEKDKEEENFNFDEEASWYLEDLDLELTFLRNFNLLERRQMTIEEAPPRQRSVLAEYWQKRDHPLLSFSHAGYIIEEEENQPPPQLGHICKSSIAEHFKHRLQILTAQQKVQGNRFNRQASRGISAASHCRRTSSTSLPFSVFHEMDNTEWKNVEEREDEGAQASTSTAAAAADIAIETTNTDNATASTTNSNSNSALDSATVEEETTDGQKDEEKDKEEENFNFDEEASWYLEDLDLELTFLRNFNLLERRQMTIEEAPPRQRSVLAEYWQKRDHPLLSFSHAGYIIEEEENQPPPQLGHICKSSIAEHFKHRLQILTAQQKVQGNRFNRQASRGQVRIGGNGSASGGPCRAEEDELKKRKDHDDDDDNDEDDHKHPPAVNQAIIAASFHQSEVGVTFKLANNIIASSIVGSSAWRLTERSMVNETPPGDPEADVKGPAQPFSSTDRKAIPSSPGELFYLRPPTCRCYHCNYYYIRCRLLLLPPIPEAVEEPISGYERLSEYRSAPETEAPSPPVMSLATSSQVVTASSFQSPPSPPAPPSSPIITAIASPTPPIKHNTTYVNGHAGNVPASRVPAAVPHTEAPDISFIIPVDPNEDIVQYNARLFASGSGCNSSRWMRSQHPPPMASRPPSPRRTSLPGQLANSTQSATESAKTSPTAGAPPGPEEEGPFSDPTSRRLFPRRPAPPPPTYKQIIARREAIAAARRARQIQQAIRISAVRPITLANEGRICYPSRVPTTNRPIGIISRSRPITPSQSPVKRAISRSQFSSPQNRPLPPIPREANERTAAVSRERILKSRSPSISPARRPLPQVPFIHGSSPPDFHAPPVPGTMATKVRTSSTKTARPPAPLPPPSPSPAPLPANPIVIITESESPREVGSPVHHPNTMVQNHCPNNNAANESQQQKVPAANGSSPTVNSPPKETAAKREPTYVNTPEYINSPTYMNSSVVMANTPISRSAIQTTSGQSAISRAASSIERQSMRSPAAAAAANCPVAKTAAAPFVRHDTTHSTVPAGTSRNTERGQQQQGPRATSSSPTKSTPTSPNAPSTNTGQTAVLKTYSMSPSSSQSPASSSTTTSPKPAEQPSGSQTPGSSGSSPQTPSPPGTTTPTLLTEPKPQKRRSFPSIFTRWYSSTRRASAIETTTSNGGGHLAQEEENTDGGKKAKKKKKKHKAASIDLMEPPNVSPSTIALFGRWKFTARRPSAATTTTTPNGQTNATNAPSPPPPPTLTDLSPRDLTAYLGNANMVRVWFDDNQQMSMALAIPGTTVRQTLERAMQLRQLEVDFCVIETLKDEKWVDWDGPIDPYIGEELKVDPIINDLVRPRVHHCVIENSFFPASCTGCSRIVLWGLRCEHCGIRFHRGCQKNILPQCRGPSPPGAKHKQHQQGHEQLSPESLFCQLLAYNDQHVQYIRQNGYGASGCAASTQQLQEQYRKVLNRRADGMASVASRIQVPELPPLPPLGPIGDRLYGSSTTRRGRSPSAPNIIHNHIHNNQNHNHSNGSAVAVKLNGTTQQLVANLIAKETESKSKLTGSKLKECNGKAPVSKTSINNKSKTSKKKSGKSDPTPTSPEATSPATAPKNARNRAHSADGTAAYRISHLFDDVQWEMSSWQIDGSQIVLGSCVGSGTYGTVFYGQYHGPVAVKKFKTSTPSEENLRDFANELAILRKTSHPNIIYLMGYTISPEPAIVTQWCDGTSLYRHLHVEETHFTPLQLLHIGLETAQGVEYLHSKSILHRDLKSNNIFLLSDLTVKIGDFGLAAIVKECHKEELSHLNEDEEEGGSRPKKRSPKPEPRRLPPPRPCNPTGSILWMAPEIIRMDTDNPYSIHSDMFAFGAVLYELGTSKLPYHHLPSKESIFYVVGRGFPQGKLDLKSMRRDVPKAFVRIVKECTEFEAAKRPNFRDILNRLREIKHRLPKISRTTSWDEGAFKKRHTDDDDDGFNDGGALYPSPQLLPFSRINLTAHPYFLQNSKDMNNNNNNNNNSHCC